MKERNASLDCCEMSYRCHILGFLDGAGGEHRETCLTAGHHVLMVSEDRKGVGCEGTGGNMEDCGKHFTRDLVHVRYHKEESL